MLMLRALLVRGLLALSALVLFVDVVFGDGANSNTKNKCKKSTYAQQTGHTTPTSYLQQLPHLQRLQPTSTAADLLVPVLLWGGRYWACPCWRLLAIAHADPFCCFLRVLNKVAEPTQTRVGQLQHDGHRLSCS